MPIFISYSTNDADFVDELAANLVKTNNHIWIDRWELHVGDSIVDRIKEQLDNATTFIFVLSKTSVKSDWCKKELTTALLREIEEHRILVLPVLLEECDVPSAIEGRRCADFRAEFDSGFREVRETLAEITSLALGRLVEPQWHVDWSTNWELDEQGNVIMEIMLVEQVEGQKYTAVSTISVTLNSVASARHLELVECGSEAAARQLVLECLVDIPKIEEIQVILEDAEVVSKELGIQDQDTALRFDILIRSRRVGVDTGRDIVLSIGNQFKQFVEQTRKRIKPLERDAYACTLAVLKKYRETLIN